MGGTRPTSKTCQVFDLAGRTSVSHACRTFGIHRWTYYAWKAQVDRGGLELLRPRERRRPRMPNQLSSVVEERIVSVVSAAMTTSHALSEGVTRRMIVR